MSDVDWDDESFEPPARTAVVMSDRWAGEDEEADVKDNWDDEKEEDEDGEKPVDNGESSGAFQVKKKKPLRERIAEKEEKKRLEQELKRKEQEDEQNAQKLSGEELAAEKSRRQKLQEESDLLLAAETFGVRDETQIGRIDGMNPSSKEDFDKFEELLREKITKYEKSPYYVPFLENLFRQISLDLESEDIKRLGSTLTTLSNEKAKQQKSTKSKKKKGKASLVVGKDVDDMLPETGGYDDYDDFL